MSFYTNNGFSKVDAASIIVEGGNYGVATVTHTAIDAPLRRNMTLNVLVNDTGASESGTLVANLEASADGGSNYDDIFTTPALSVKEIKQYQIGSLQNTNGDPYNKFRIATTVANESVSYMVWISG